jgi:hypothetical protein
MAGVHPEQSKIFCIGLNKTGTRSLRELFRNLDYRIGDLAIGELLLDAWKVRQFEPIIWLACTADFFKDIPFSCPDTYQALDRHFKSAKFILTVRDSAEQWCRSLTRYHSKITGGDRVPTLADLSNYPYRYPGWMARAMKLIYEVSDDDPYEPTHLMNFYEKYNHSVVEYFRDKSDRLLLVNLASDDSIQRIFKFIGREYDGTKMPHLNAS